MGRLAVPARAEQQLNVHVKTFFTLVKVLKCHTPCEVVGDGNYTVPGFRLLTGKAVFIFYE